ncbi:MAG: response regulator [Spirochaetaceae bacterium]|jgi:PleD family two-component response regulator|nr:response regulator [Spirochaetaceae bacterium]
MKTILAIDDVATNLTAVRSILHDYFEICLARTVEAAFLVLERSKIDLILCDISMPGVDGFQFLAKVRQDLRYAKIPVVFITGHTSPEFVQKAIGVGVDGYIIKPINADILLDKVNDLLFGKPEIVLKHSPEMDIMLRRLKELAEYCELGKADQADATIRDLVKTPTNQQVTDTSLKAIASHIADIEYPEALVNIRKLIRILSPMKQNN